MSLTIDGIRLDDPQHVYVIAEASANHCRDLGKARALVEAAHAAGAQACKFQTFSADRIAAPNIIIPRGFDPAHDAWLDRIGATTVQDVLSQGGLPWEWHAELQALATSLGISFLSTPFSLEDAKFLVEEIKVPALKIASGDLTFEPLLRYASECTTIPLIVSTGGATLGECDHVLHGPLRQAWLESRVVLLHCVSIYPAPAAAVNLRAITTLREYFGVTAGFSDHTLDFQIVPAMAVAQGCCVYEKHFTLDRGGGSVDGPHSLEPGEFKKMVEVLRKAPSILGNGEKKPHALEKHDLAWARRDSTDWRRPTKKAREGAWE